MKRSFCVLGCVLLAVLVSLGLLACSGKGTQQIPSSTLPAYYAFSFDSYASVKQAFTEQDSPDYMLIHEEQSKYGAVYQQMLSQLEKGDMQIGVPQLNGSEIPLRNKEGFSNITLFTRELYSLPWLWYHCVVNDQLLDVRISYLRAVKDLDITSDKSYCDVLSILAPAAPTPDNYSTYAEYQAIYEKPLLLADGSTVVAMISELKGRSECYVMFHYNHVLVCLCAEKELFTEDFWNSFALDFQSFP